MHKQYIQCFKLANILCDMFYTFFFFALYCCCNYANVPNVGLVKASEGFPETSNDVITCLVSKRIQKPTRNLRRAMIGSC